MSWSRTIYDEPAYRHQLLESMGSAAYIFDSNPTNKRECDLGITTDESSELLGLNRKLSRCPAETYLPIDNRPMLCRIPDQLGYTPDFIRDEHTKISNPPTSLRGKGVNRFEHLCQNPQTWALNPFHFQRQDKMEARDNHVPIMLTPDDPMNVFPPPSQGLPKEEYVFVPTPSLPVILPNTREELHM